MHKVPAIGLSAFSCPHCRAYAHVQWFIPRLTETNPPDGIVALRSIGKVQVSHDDFVATIFIAENAYITQCKHCGGTVIWAGGSVVWPRMNIAPPPHADMPTYLLADYQEAADILPFSTRGAAALLRLCIQKLLEGLGAGNKLNEAIASYVGKGLDSSIVDAMDILRVIGNCAVHPLEMDIADDLETATALFNLLNLIVERLVSQPNKTAELLSKLPEGARRAIEARNSKAAGKPS